ncbi:MAG TPA: CoA transferase [Gammaproteobacteria bacterium]|nr:CoA transferase [Gammaproteobacteria bacterium]HIL98409.1 CoA transferase [Pseudomonadales bacterium]
MIEAMLSPYRVLDLTDHRGELAAMILGDLGADVIKIEPPGGSSGRGNPGSQANLQFLAFNRNKRSIVLDLITGVDRDVLKALVSGADFVLESAYPGMLEQYGIGFAELKAANPNIIHVLITPYGADGPAAERVANDLTLSAMGGQASLQGSPDRAPVRVTVPQIWRHVGAEAAAAALIAHARMLVTHEAQFVDLSAQCTATWTTMNAMNAFEIQGFDFERMGSVVQMGTRQIDPVFPCADGYLVALPIGPVVEPLLGHLIGDGLADASWLEEDWTTLGERLLLGEETLITAEQIRETLSRFFLLHTKSELFQWGLEAGVTLAPVNTVADLLEFDQLAARDAWTTIDIPAGGKVRTPGIFARLSKTPMSIRLAAPNPGEHTKEILDELADKPRAPATVVQKDGDSHQSESDRPFDGLLVIDLTWVIAGPASVRYLSDHGATVIKVESELRPDGLRFLGPIRGSEPGWNKSHFYGEFNAGKKCIQLNLKQPAALDILKKLIAKADILVENWAPGATQRLGIHYAACRELNPELIMLSTSLMGQTGPASEVAGFGYHAGGMAGFYEVTGYSDLPPHGPWLAYTDVIAPHFIAAMITGAIDHRRRTGQGQHIDAAQFEMAIQFLAPEIIETQTNGYSATRLGNRARDAAPQGIYPCAGEDQWCAIGVDTDEQWRTLAGVLGEPQWMKDPAFEDVSGRLANHDFIDEQLSRWTKSRSPQAVMDELTSQGVPAGAVQRSSDLSRDPQFAHRQFRKVFEHPEMGQVPYAGNQFRIPGYEAGPYSYAPMLGEHNTEILKEMLGMNDKEIADAIASGVVQ